MPKPVEGNSAYNPGLDGIRAIAVLGVIAYHLGFGWASGGLLGVGVFFVLSGYLITDLLVAEYQRSGGIRLGMFWLRRARRLLPALFVMLFATVVWASLFDRDQLTHVREDLLPGIFYVSNWWDIVHHVPYFEKFGPPSVFGHLWSLAIEEQFYVFWPLILLVVLHFVRNRRAIIVGLGIIAAISIIEMAVLFTANTDPTRVYEGTDTRVFALLIGAMLAFAWPRGRTFARITPGARNVLDLLGVGALVGILVLYAQTSQFSPFVYRGGMVLLSLFTALVIAICVHPGARLGRVLGIEPLRWLGERSYGMYLWQFPVIIMTTSLHASPSIPRGLLQTAAIIVLATLSWRFVEQPVRHGALWASWKRLRSPDRARTPMTPQRWALGGIGAFAVLIFMLGISGVIPATSSATPAETNVLPPSHSIQSVASRHVGGHGVTAIGDSVMIDAAPYLRKTLPGIIIDARIGQQLYQVAQRAKVLKKQGDVGSRLVIELGTNGPYSPKQLAGLLGTLGPSTQIVLVNTYAPVPWEGAINGVIRRVATTYPHATLLDWHAAAGAHPNFFYKDGVHLRPAGGQYLAALIRTALNPPVPPPTTKTTGTGTTTTPAPK